MKQQPALLKYDWSTYPPESAMAYEEFMVPALFQPWARRLVELAGPLHGKRVLDLACGTGIVARLVCPHVGDGGVVHGVDLNPHMVAVAGGLAAPPGAQIHWRVADAKDLPLPGASIDLILCQQGLAFLDPRDDAMVEARRVAAAGARLLASVWQPIETSPGFAELARALGELVSPEAGAAARSPFVLGDPQELAQLVRNAGFSDCVVLQETGWIRMPSARAFVQRYLGATPLGRTVRHAGASVEDAVIAAVERALRSYTDPNGLLFPIAANTVLASV